MYSFTSIFDVIIELHIRNYTFNFNHINKLQLIFRLPFPYSYTLYIIYAETTYKKLDYFQSIHFILM